MMTDHDPITGADLKDWGHRPGKQFGALLARANALRAEGFGLVRIRQELEGAITPEPPRMDLRAPGELSFHENIAAAGVDVTDTPDGAQWALRTETSEDS